MDEAGRIVEYSDYGIIRQLRADVIHMSLSNSIRKDLFFSQFSLENTLKSQQISYDHFQIWIVTIHIKQSTFISTFSDPDSKWPH